MLIPPDAQMFMSMTKAALALPFSLNAEFGSHADSSRCPVVFEHDESCSCLAVQP